MHKIVILPIIVFGIMIGLMLYPSPQRNGTVIDHSITYELGPYGARQTRHHLEIKFDDGEVIKRTTYRKISVGSRVCERGPLKQLLKK